jgi:hypothetical protein
MTRMIKISAENTVVCWDTLKSTDHKDYHWVTIEQLRDYDFAPADIPFVNKMLSGEIELKD